MSSQPFTFPPPPPPPKRTEGASQPTQGFQNNRGPFRGSHSYRGNTRGGRGGHGSYRPGPTTSSAVYGQNASHKPLNNGSQRGGFLNPPQKRDHNTAFNPGHQHRPRPTAAPAVPSFNATIEHLLARRPSGEQTSQNSPEPKKVEPKKHNLLGLTPAKFDRDSDPEDDEDEEQRLANKTAPDVGGYIFEYNGHPLALRTREEILRWVAERKRRFPTQARIEAAKKEAEEKKRKWEEEQQAKREARKEALAKRDQERAEKEKAIRKAKQAREQERRFDRDDKTENMDATARAKLKADKLRKRALKAQQELEKAEEALRLAETKENTSVSLSGATGPSPSPTTEAADVSSNSDLTDSEATSSSGSSTTSGSDSGTDSAALSNSDSSPEVTSSKQVSRAHPSFRPGPRTARGQMPQPCKHFVKYKTCKWGSSCRYSHDLPRKNGRSDAGARTSQGENLTTTAAGNVRRKGLWQVLVEKEREESRKRLLGAIITLGEKGLLEGPLQKAGDTA
ncbi:uncharacterized protein Z519_11704 [Cladophialophora bantiana CBS 173.52]|uniref:C3H1-type domain-containing protein n=1 Tax=Cladophialophora bantiana (strain ATCC 10958 / CBS 173.52 / CDC B-1940 / NIH 8579) TaxID=1442370 RepID=A0A0D2H9Z9_CLAB1|nr:uncharacterized protein Z519_11704 [Cladophialophora bantiana CBS 173.52]KIW87730.1 hypothetical protein Z519_11704 [Cladophialophora bantiana CBS 173.52]